MLTAYTQASISCSSQINPPSYCSNLLQKIVQLSSDYSLLKHLTNFSYASKQVSVGFIEHASVIDQKHELEWLVLICQIFQFFVLILIKSSQVIKSYIKLSHHVLILKVMNQNITWNHQLFDNFHSDE
ncbi:Hypothetical_protein [Hexamita inflata]|uniref:Hypothetical_protein n=1 Tax=Hexamita inflata TaxID=28002 RepID=A0AA86PVL0_9EUKA|nr:Hypothetical protein HINF_LOCUS33478 [Hexamita inflata]